LNNTGMATGKMQATRETKRERRWKAVGEPLLSLKKMTITMHNSRRIRTAWAHVPAHGGRQDGCSGRGRRGEDEAGSRLSAVESSSSTCWWRKKSGAGDLLCPRRVVGWASRPMGSGRTSALLAPGSTFKRAFSAISAPLGLKPSYSCSRCRRGAGDSSCWPCTGPLAGSWGRAGWLGRQLLRARQRGKGGVTTHHGEGGAPGRCVASTSGR
jgi:hypothetical protein